jgi:hypothetical protein
LHSSAIPNAITSSETISVTIPKSILNCHPETISKHTKALSKAIGKSNSCDSDYTTLLKEGGLRKWLGEAVGSTSSVGM